MKNLALTKLTALFYFAMRCKGDMLTLEAQSAKAIRGSVSGQDVAVLARRQQTGVQNNWATYKEITAASGGFFIAEFDFQYDGDVSEIVGIAVLANSIGPASSQQKRVVKVLKDATWVTIANNNQAPSWQWFWQRSDIESSFGSYFSGTGKLKLRVQSNNDHDVMDLDYLVVQVDVNAGGGRWEPKASDGLTWQWQLQGVIDQSLDVDVYDVDLFDTSEVVIQSLQNQGRKVICYFSAGTYEGWRSDWGEFFSFILGGEYMGTDPPFAGNMASWDERWLDIRFLDLLKPIMSSRIQLAIEKGCDAIEPDNMDAYTNGSETKKPITANHQLVYNRWIADEAHRQGISVGLKNDVSQLPQLVNYYDFAVNEQCFQYNECSGYYGGANSFVGQNKAVFGVEYNGSTANFCPVANSQQLSWMKKRLDLGVWRQGCTD